jgi:hypothetical protein
MPQIMIEEAARRWLANHGAALTLRLSPRHGCCGGRAEVPVAEARCPADETSYWRQDQDGISIYCAEQLNAGPMLMVRLESLLGMKRLFIEAPDPEGPTATDTTQGAS